jgi:beta-lactamase regulating signal transducer with metallopeptidase domain
MIAPWLLYATFVGALLGACGLLGERILRWRGEPARWLWLAAIVMTVLAPVLLNLIPPDPFPSVATASMSGRHGLIERSIALDRPVLILWLLASTLLALRVLGAAIALRRRRRAWVPAQLAGHAVLLTDELGPAVIGWRRFTTVIPRWALTFDERARALMLEHEAEHARSGDPYLRSVALVALILMPWNPAIWWAMRRLRLAVEIDCDRRLISRGVDPHRYASLLLAVGERMSAVPFVWATALGGSPSSLEQRIRAMTSSSLPRHPRIAIAGANAAVLLLAAIGCSVPVPDPIVPPAAPETVAAAHPTAHVPFLMSDCKIGSACAAGPDEYVVFRKTLRDAACEAESGCPEKAVSVITGDSIRTAGDTIYVYRRNKSASGELETRVAPLHDEVRLTSEPAAPAAATEYCTAEQAVQAKRDRDAGNRYWRRCP